MVMGARKFILLTIFVVLLGTSREVWAQKISIHMNNATLEEVLKKIKKKTKYDMMYQMKDVKEIDSRRSVHFDETELQEVLTFCLTLSATSTYMQRLCQQIIDARAEAQE